METQPVSVPLSQKLRVPADIVFITLPLLCWALIIFRRYGLLVTQPWMVGVTVLYYAVAAAYLVFAVMVRMRVVEIVGLLLLVAASLFMWLPYYWVLAILFGPAVLMAFRKRGSNTAAVVFTVLAGVYILFTILLSFTIKGLLPDKYAYHKSPDGHYTVLEHQYQWLFYISTDIELYRAYGPLLVHERALYLANGSDFGGDIEWLDESTIRIYGDTMDVFKDPVIKNYDPL